MALIIERGEKMKILTVDDSSVIRKIISSAAAVLEYEVIEAIDGIDGLEKLEANDGDFDLILLDWNMPRMNGLEFLKTVKADEKYKNIHVMMITTESQKENIIKAIKEGAAHYMTKPFTMDELIKKILECLGKGGV